MAAPFLHKSANAETHKIMMLYVLFMVYVSSVGTRMLACYLCTYGFACMPACLHLYHVMLGDEPILDTSVDYTQSFLRPFLQLFSK